MGALDSIWQDGPLTHLNAMRDAGVKTAALVLSWDFERDLAESAITGHDLVYVDLPMDYMQLGGISRIGIKLLLNAISTCTMVRLGRVMGNYMIYVVPSNLKLIDRSTRYISQLTGLGYEDANRLLFEVIEYIEPRMKSDKAHPPAVGLAVMRHKHGIGNEEAEKRLLGESNA
jgi:hypothetical protein